jgi:hypothetical protein
MKGVLVFVCACIVAIGIGIFLFAYGPQSLQSDVQSALQTSQSSQSSQTADSGPKAIPFTILEQGTETFSIADRTNYRITSTLDLETLWPLIYGEKDAPKIPQVDFSKYEVLALFDGTHSTGGFGIQLLNIDDQNYVRTLNIAHIIPGPTCTPGDGVTEPFEIVQVPITTYSLSRVDTTSTSTCATN